jgi:hypothetical protein
MTPSEAIDASIPEGFARHPRRSPLTEPWEPIYAKITPDAFILESGWQPAHQFEGTGSWWTDCRAGRQRHGIELRSQGRQGVSQGLITVNLSVDYLGSATLGQWLQIDTTFVKPGNSIFFAQCFVTADGEPCARANATFKALRKKP